jgi:ribosome recycling factor
MDEASVRQKMQKAIDTLAADIATIRTGRAAPSLIENLTVAVYGGTQKLRILELASISTPDPQTLVIDPWDKSIIGEIKKGIEAANIGMNPAIDGEIIRISMPPLTTEDREKYVKLLSTKLEQGKIVIRQIRGEAMHDTKKAYEDKTITEDQKFGQEKKVQELTDEFTRKIEEAGEKKKQELLQL